ncbi:hypothetical protein D1AOALGA4SA_7361 [Olavius algarvensis Delta 1 endosymbiont]|nr:hypothetical protein D1AOALGA4SA_7361 [Olavius algarvensis Delta 1 endosymbiont]
MRDERIAGEGADLFSSAASHLVKIQRVYSRLIIDMRRPPQRYLRSQIPNLKTKILNEI